MWYFGGARTETPMLTYDIIAEYPASRAKISLQ